MKYIKRGKFSLRKEYIGHVIGIFCILILILPAFDDDHNSAFHNIRYVFILKISFLTWAITSFYLAFIILKQYFIINNNPIAKVASAAQGYTALEGIQACILSETIKSPISKTPCTWYSYIIEEYKKTLGRNKSWTVIENGESDKHFTLTDVTGQCIIYPENADVFPSTIKVSYGNGSHIDNNIASRWLFSKYRYTEQLLLPNTHVYVIGVFRTIFASISNNQDKEQREEVLNILKEWKKDYKSLLEKFDTNKDGTISAEEWEKAVKYAEEQIRQKYQKNNAEQTNSINIISKEGLMLDQPFIISALRKKEVTNKFKIKFICYAGLFVILTIITFTLEKWYPDFVAYSKKVLQILKFVHKFF
jgi:hypothetical protein